MTAGVHPLASVDPGARVHPEAFVGPFCVVGPEVVLEAGARLEASVAALGRIRVGPRSRVFPFASLNAVPQDLKYKGEASRIEIGADTSVREHATVHAGTGGGSMETRVGDRVLVMSGCHVAHDVRIDDDAIVASNAALGGHVHIGAGAMVAGGVCVHQWARVGAGALAGHPRLERDLPPHVVLGREGYLGPNLVRLRRRGVPAARVRRLEEALEALFRGGAGRRGADGRLRGAAGEAAARAGFAPALDALEASLGAGGADGDDDGDDDGALAREVVAFLRAPSRRGGVDSLLFRPAADGDGPAS